MNNIQDIEAAVEQLAPEQRAQFRAWFAAFDSQEWDQQMEQDLGAGRLDWLADEAIADLGGIGTHAEYDQLLMK